MIASFSFIGNPANIVKKSIDGIKDFYNTAFLLSDSLIFGIGKGSMNLIKGVTTGALEGFIEVMDSFEKNLLFFNSNENTERQILKDLGQAISGVVAYPYQEFQSNGFLGLLRGTGKGLYGLIAYPTSSLFSIFKKTGIIILQKVGNNPVLEDKRLEKEENELPIFIIDE